MILHPSCARNAFKKAIGLMNVKMKQRIVADHREQRSCCVLNRCVDCFFHKNKYIFVPPSLLNHDRHSYTYYRRNRYWMQTRSRKSSDLLQSSTTWKERRRSTRGWKRSDKDHDPLPATQDHVLYLDLILQRQAAPLGQGHRRIPVAPAAARIRHNLVAVSIHQGRIAVTASN